MIKPTINQLTPLSKTRFLSLYDANYKNRVGEDKHWMIATRKTEEDFKKQFFNNEPTQDDAVVLVPIHEETKCLVLIRQFRLPLNDFVYELPAGLIDAGDDALSTVARELKEETGLKLLDIKHVQDKLYLSPGMTDESVSLVYCTCTGDFSTDYLEADELIEPLLVSKADAKELLSSGVKLDVKVYLVLQQFITNALNI